MVSRSDGGPIGPSEFGEQLRRTREAAGLVIEDISAETKVSPRILSALETGDFKSLPERVFARSFVAQYARTVGVEASPLIESFDVAWDRFTEDTGSRIRLDVNPDDLRPSIHWRFWIPIATGVMILLVAAAVILLGSSAGGDGLAPDPRRSKASFAGDGRDDRPDLLPTRAPSPVVVPRETETDSVVQLVVEVDPGQECWIQYRDRDGMTGERLLTGGQRVALELTGPVKLTVGNAGAARVTVDGRTYRDLGQPGEVIHTEITDRGFAPLDAGGFES